MLRRLTRCDSSAGTLKLQVLDVDLEILLLSFFIWILQNTTEQFTDIELDSVWTCGPDDDQRWRILHPQARGKFPVTIETTEGFGSSNTEALWLQVGSTTIPACLYWRVGNETQDSTMSPTGGLMKSVAQILNFYWDKLIKCVASPTKKYDFSFFYVSFSFFYI